MKFLKSPLHSVVPLILAAALVKAFPQSPGIVSGSIYTLSAKTGGNLLDVANSSMVDGANIGIWSDTKSDAQRWLVTSVGNNLYTLTNVGSGRLLHIANATPSAAVKVNQNANTNDNTVRWNIVDAGGGFYQVKPAAGADFALSLPAGAAAGGSLVQLGQAAGDAQLWSLQAQAPQDAAPAAAIADRVFATWKARFYSVNASGNGSVSGEGFWGVAEIMEVVDDAYEVTGYAKYRDMFAEMYKGFIAKNGADWMNNDYNDDIAWMVLACVRAGLMTGNQTYIAKAKEQYDKMYARAWTMDFGGGLVWKQGSAGKMSCVNGPGAIAAMYLGQATGDTSYFRKAVEIYAWSKLYLLVRSTGKVNDNYNGPGRIGTASTTYNQGTFLGAAVMLYNLTGDTTYRNDALKIADYTQNTMFRAGVINTESGTDLNGFKGILMRYTRRYLVDLNQPGIIPWLQINARAAYNNRNAAGLINTLWGTRAADTTRIGAFSMSTAVSLLFNCPLLTTTVKNPYVTMEAERFDYLKGITVVPTADAGGGEQVGGLQDGFYTAYMNVDFGAKGSKSLEFRVASAAAGGSVEIRLGGISGALIGTVAIPNTGAANTFSTVNWQVANTTGLRNVYLVYRGAANPAGINNFKFFQDGDGSQVRNPLRAEPLKLRLNNLGTVLSVDMGGAGAGRITLADARGRVWYRRLRTASGPYAIDVSGFPRGAYYFTFASQGDKVSEKVLLR